MGTSGEYGAQVFEILPEGQEDHIRRAARFAYIGGISGVIWYFVIVLQMDIKTSIALIVGGVMLIALLFGTKPLMRRVSTRPTALGIDIGSIAWLNGTRELFRISRSDVTTIEESDESIIVRTKSRNRRIIIRRFYFAPDDLAEIEQELGRWKQGM